jgi:hypothetical protein
MQQAKQPDMMNFCANFCKEGAVAPTCPGLGLLAIPYVGYYNNGAEYQWAVPEIVLKLPLELLPSSAQSLLEGVDAANIDLFFVVADAATLCQYSPRCNMVYHAWACPDLQPQQTQEMTVLMGIVDPVGISPAGSLPFGELAPFSVHAHPAEGGAMACSPDNAHFLNDVNRPITSWVSVGRLGNRAVVSVHWLINQPDDAEYCKLCAASAASSTLTQFLKFLRLWELAPEYLTALERLFHAS